MKALERYQVDGRRCIRCAACATVAEGLFVVEAQSARMLRAPADEAERHACEAALLLCPTSAIRREADHAG
jgi:ferredoxin